MHENFPLNRSSLSKAGCLTQTIRQMAPSLEMTAILRLKRNKLQYRMNTGVETQLLDARELYQLAVGKQWKKVRGMPFKAVEMIVEVDWLQGKEKTSQAITRK